MCWAPVIIIRTVTPSSLDWCISRIQHQRASQTSQRLNTERYLFHMQAICLSGKWHKNKHLFHPVKVLITADENRRGSVTFQILILLERRNSVQCETNGRHSHRLQERNGILQQRSMPSWSMTITFHSKRTLWFALMFTQYVCALCWFPFLVRVLVWGYCFCLFEERS